MDYEFNLSVRSLDVAKNGNFQFSNYYGFADHWLINTVATLPQFVFTGSAQIGGAKLHKPGNVQLAQATQDCLEDGGLYEITIVIDSLTPSGGLGVDVQTGSAGTINSFLVPGTFTFASSQGGDNLLTIKAHPNVITIIHSIEVTYRGGERTAATFDTPNDWNKTRVKMSQHSLFRGVFTTFNSSVEWQGDAAQFIEEQIERFGEESLLDLNIKQKCSPEDYFSDFVVPNAEIKLSDIKRNVEQCTIKTKLIANGLADLVNKYKDIKVNMFDELSINGVDIGAASIRSCLYKRNAINPVYGNRNGWLLHDMFEHIIRHITDGQYDVNSPTLGHPTAQPSHGYSVPGEFGFMFCNTGNELRNNTARTEASVSLKDLFTMANASLNLIAEPREVGGVLKFFIEDAYSYYDQVNGSIGFDNVPNIMREDYDEASFSTAAFGYSLYEDEGTLNDEYFASTDWAFHSTSSTTRNYNMISAFVASRYITEAKLLQPSTNVGFEFDERWFICNLDGGLYTMHLYYLIPFNEELYPGIVAGRHRPTLYESFRLTGYTAAANKYIHLSAVANKVRTMKEVFDDYPGFVNLDLWFDRKFKFKIGLPYDDFALIAAEPHKKILVSQTTLNPVNGFKGGWIKVISWSIGTHEADFEIYGVPTIIN